MDSAIITAIVSGVVAVLVALISNRAKTLKEVSGKIDTLAESLRTEREMSIAGVRDRLRHYGHKYLKHSEEVSLNALRDWCDLYDKYKKNGGNGYVADIYEKILELRELKEIEEER